MIGWESQYQSIPFVDKGRTFAGCDCWGLVRLILFREKNIETPSYDTISADDLIAVEKQQRVPGWTHVPTNAWNAARVSQPFDVALLRFPEGFHLGIVSSARKLLHTCAGTGVVHLGFSHFSIAPRFVSLHRRVELVA